jgi:hypothetical protein
MPPVAALLGPLACVGLGVAGLVAPDAVARATGLAATGPPGRTELRAAFGGLFVALGAGCIVLGDPAAYLLVGAALFAGAAVKAVSAVAVRGVAPAVVPGLAFDVVAGALCLWGAAAVR